MVTYTAHALLRKKKMDKKEDEEHMRVAHQLAFVKDILKRYSSNHSVLNSKEVAAWLSSLSPDGVISDDELKWILILGNKATESDDKHDWSVKALDVEHAVVFPDTFEFVMESWRTYLKHKQTIHGIFHKFHMDRHGSLPRADITKMLTMLNDDETPEEQDVHWALQSVEDIGDGDKLEKAEVLQLISAWYIRPSLDELLEEEDAHDPHVHVDGGLSRKASMQLSRKHLMHGSSKENFELELPHSDPSHVPPPVSAPVPPPAHAPAPAPAPPPGTQHKGPAVVAPTPVCGPCRIQ